MQKFSLNYSPMLIEQLFGANDKKFTSVSNVMACLLGLLFTLIFYGILLLIHLNYQIQMVDMFFHGGPSNRSTIPYYTMYLTFVCLAFLFIKWRKLKLQQMAFTIDLFPKDKSFVISRMNADSLIRNIHSRVFHSENSMLLWRAECALSNLNNIGKISEVSSVLNDLAENDSNYVASTYTMPKGLIWAIPVLGFIGTVLGLSQAVGGFGAVVASGAALDELKSSLAGVTSGLGTAFETTLIALVAALVVQLIMTLVLQKEEEFLDKCSAYCYENITSKLKMIDLDEQFDNIEGSEVTEEK